MYAYGRGWRNMFVLTGAMLVIGLPFGLVANWLVAQKMLSENGVGFLFWGGLLCVIACYAWFPRLWRRG
jgi:hypothetical protein